MTEIKFDESRPCDYTIRVANSPVTIQTQYLIVPLSRTLLTLHAEGPGNEATIVLPRAIMHFNCCSEIIQAYFMALCGQPSIWLKNFHFIYFFLLMDEYMESKYARYIFTRYRTFEWEDTAIAVPKNALVIKALMDMHHDQGMKILSAMDTKSKVIGEMVKLGMVLKWNEIVDVVPLSKLFAF